MREREARRASVGEDDEELDGDADSDSLGDDDDDDAVDETTRLAFQFFGGSSRAHGHHAHSEANGGDADAVDDDDDDYDDDDDDDDDDGELEYQGAHSEEAHAWLCTPTYIDAKGHVYDALYRPLTGDADAHTRTLQRVMWHRASSDTQAARVLAARPLGTQLVNALPPISADPAEERVRAEDAKLLRMVGGPVFRSFPMPHFFDSFEEYESAALEWRDAVRGSVGMLRLPTLMGATIPRPPISSHGMVRMISLHSLENVCVRIVWFCV